MGMLTMNNPPICAQISRPLASCTPGLPPSAPNRGVEFLRSIDVGSSHYPLANIQLALHQNHIGRRPVAGQCREDGAPRRLRTGHDGWYWPFGRSCTNRAGVTVRGGIFRPFVATRGASLPGFSMYRRYGIVCPSRRYGWHRDIVAQFRRRGSATSTCSILCCLPLA
jgi:hypothetical protein